MDTPTSTPTPASPEAPRLPLSWSAPSHYNYERSTRWYQVGGAAVAVASLYGILTGAWSVALVSVLVGGVYFLIRHEPMPVHEISIETDGLQFKGSFIPWSEFKDFWMVATPLYTELHITRKERLKGNIRIQTGDIDPTVIRAALSQYLTIREDQKEYPVDALLRICKL
ncbi:hypothetical protein EXS70_04730 [Candidatus Peribacteria bacterium]|nr:hypothetical protein [Candidatus Peribacteria bacterium]